MTVEQALQVVDRCNGAFRCESCASDADTDKDARRAVELRKAALVKALAVLAST